MLTNFINATYIAAGLMFILALAGLSKHETARKGNVYGIMGMVFALVATNFAIAYTDYANHNLQFDAAVMLYAALGIGAVIGIWKARKVQMTGMPELIALLHSFVGAAAVLVGFNVHLDHANPDALHMIEVYLGIFIGAVTFTGSLVAWGKLNGKVKSKPLTLPGRHWLNLAVVVALVLLGWWYLSTGSIVPLAIATVLSLLLGAHLVAAIGGADMPVVISMLNSYSGWAAAASGFMLDMTVLIITGALVGASGAILSYIMCKAMNRQFVSVILGGFGGAVAASDRGPHGAHRAASRQDLAPILAHA
ncbi:MAG TPA: NAD(P)(+) transhydrogenase (Re/Si-specific) subunit beta, partial [Arachnia sp.]|nr:NAD(P)(+) transhydrogenase (Re/Si-specific) subunit beta [Arachnia sp.]